MVLGAALLLGIVGCLVFSFVLAPRKMRHFCERVRVGTSRADLQSAAENLGFDATALSEGIRSLITDGRSFGRFGCLVKYGKDGVTSAEYTLND
jgi:hypothetical protein